MINYAKFAGDFPTNIHTMTTLLIYNLQIRWFFQMLQLVHLLLGFTNWESVGNCPISQQIPTPLQLLTLEYFSCSFLRIGVSTLYMIT